MMRSRQLPRRADASIHPPRADRARVRVSSVFCASDSVGTAPRPRRSSGTKCRPSARGARAGEARAIVAAEQPDRSGGGAPVLARERGQQLLLAVARDAGDADDLAGAHLEARCRRASTPNWSSLRQRQVAHAPARRRRLRRRGAAAAAARRRSSGATGWRWSPACGSTSPVTLPPRSTVQCVAQRADLVELVADVEDASSPRGELAQHRRTASPPPAASAPTSARRGSAASGSVSSARTISTRWRLAHRQRVHRPARIDVEAVLGATLARCARHLVQRQLLSRPSQTFSADGQRVEQREVLEHHAMPSARASLRVARRARAGRPSGPRRRRAARRRR